MAIKKTYGSLKYYNNKWEITSLEPHAIIKLKALFSGIRLTAKPPFVFKDTLDIVMDLEWFMHRYPTK